MPKIEIQSIASNKPSHNDNEPILKDSYQGTIIGSKFASPCWCATVGDERPQVFDSTTLEPSIEPRYRLSYPTWTLLQRNECPNELRRLSLRGLGQYHDDSTRERAHSTPPPSFHGRQAQKSATRKVRDELKRSNTIGSCHDLEHQSDLKIQRKSSFRNTSYFGKDFAEKSCSEDEHKLGDHSLRSQTSFSARNGFSRNIGSMPFPHNVTAQVSCYMSSIARMKLIKHLSDIQRGYHTCVAREKDKICRESDLLYSTRPRLCENLKLEMDGVSIPRPHKEQGCEDAYWCDTDGRAFIVADGVGEWYSYGMHPGIFSRAVVDLTKSMYLNYKGYSILDAESEAASANLASLISGMREISKPDSLIFGATTVIMASLYSSGSKICITNLGDCTFMLLRRDNRKQFKMNIVKRTKESMHSFNCPKQLLNFPSTNKYDLLRENGMENLIPHVERARKLAQERGVDITSDHPLDSDTYKLSIKEGDLIICGSDGIFDNLFDNDIADICSYAISPYEAELIQNYKTTCTDANSKTTDTCKLIREWLRGQLPHPSAIEPPESHFDKDGNLKYYTPTKNIANALIQASLSRALDPKSYTPFCKNAKRAGFDCRGGKLDDSTVVAAWVIQNDT